MKTLTLGLLGCGQIGSAVYSLLKRKSAALSQETGSEIKIAGIAVRHLRKKRAGIPASLLTDRAESLVKDPSIDVIVELIGGTDAARRLVTQALENGKDVITANKALLAEYGDEIFETADRNGRQVFFEASVGGGIPVIKTLREGLVANEIESIHSIINGTSNYILSEMTEKKLDFKEALDRAKEKGYAEADPSLDIDGTDAAHKLAILVRLAFGGYFPFQAIHCEGISEIRHEDIAFAEEFGYRIKLLAIAKRGPEGVEARVQPTLLPQKHILANVSGSFNGILMSGDEVGEILLYGRGAGPGPTASAVVSDLVDRAKGGLNRRGAKDSASRKKLKIRGLSSILSRYYLRFKVEDKPGVLSGISTILGRHQVSISDVIQRERKLGGVVPLILLTYEVPEKELRQAIAEIDRLQIVKGKSQVIRIEAHPQ